MSFLSKLFKATQNAQTNDRTPTYISNVTTAPTHSLPGCDPVRQPKETEPSRTETLGITETSEVATPNYSKHPSGILPLVLLICVNLLVYYRIYTEDGAIPSKTPVAPDDPFLGRIIARFVPPPRNAKAVKRSISKVENIKDRESSSIFLTPYSESPMDDADKFSIHNGTGPPGSTPQEPLALVAKMTDSEESERRASKSRGRAAKPETTPPDIRHGTSIQHS
jgi:hypothetical protein